MASISRVALALIASAGMSSALAQTAVSKEVPATPVRTDFAPRIGGGLTAFKDPDTGLLRSPTTAEMQALHALLPSAPPKTPAVEFALASGGFGMAVDPSFDTFALMSKRPDGTLAFECIAPHEALAAAQAPKPRFEKTVAQFRKELPDVQ